MIATSNQVLPQRPYRGIEPFRYIDRAIFAAREEESWTLRSLVTIYRGVLLYGESGTGKSSLIDAGFIPAIEQAGFIPNRLRLRPHRGEEIVLERIPTSDADDSPYMPSTFAAGTHGPAQQIYSLADFRRRLFALRDTPSAGTRPLLIFDQFEEFITLFEETARGDEASGETWAAAEKVRQEILEVLVELLQEETLPIKLLFAFREEYLAKLNILFARCPDIIDHYLHVQAPHSGELPEIIHAPFARLPGHFGQEISLELARKIATAMSPPRVAVNLSEVQIVCLKLWESKDPTTLFRRKNIKDFITEYFQSALDNFEALRDPAVALLGQLVTSSNTRNVVSDEDLLSRVAAEEDVQATQAQQALDALVAAKLVRREPRSQVNVYEIVSEYLVPWIIDQRMERRAKLKLKREAEVERTKRRRRRLLLFGAAAVIAVSVGLFVYHQHAAARFAQEEAQRQRELADTRHSYEQIILMLRLLASQKAEERLEGIRQIGVFGKDNKLPPEVGRALLQNVITDSDPEVAQAASLLLTQATRNDQGLKNLVFDAAKSDPKLADRLPARITIAISSEQQKAKAEEVKAALERKGLLVLNIDMVENAPPRDQLRFFLFDDKDKAKEAASGLRDILPDLVTVRPSSHGNPKPGLFELWLATEEEVAPAGAQWYLHIHFAPTTDASRNELKKLLEIVRAKYPDGQLSFPAVNSAEMGPYNQSEAEALRAEVKSTLQRSSLRKKVVTLEPRTP